MGEVEKTMGSNYINPNPVFENSAFVSIYFHPIYIDADGIILNKVFGKNLVKFNSLQQNKNQLDLSDVLSNFISNFQTHLHMPFLGDGFTHNEFLDVYLNMDSVLKSIPFKSSFFYNTYPGVVGLFWLEFKEFPLVFLKNDFSRPQIHLDVTDSEGNPLYSARIKAFLNFSSATWNRKVEGDTLPKKVVLCEFRGFCTYPIKTQLNTIMDRWTEVFPSLGQLDVRPFLQLPTLSAQQSFFIQLLDWLFIPILTTVRTPIWVRLQHEKSLQDLHSTLPISDRFGPARLFQLNKNNIFSVFENQRELFACLGLKFFLPEFFKQNPEQNVTGFEKSMIEIELELQKIREKCQRYKLRSPVKRKKEKILPHQKKKK